MGNWFADYHHALQFRLLVLVFVFGVLWPGLALVMNGLRSVGLRARLMWNDARVSRGHML